MRPTISLCLIAKNEAHNVPVLFESIRGCYDEIIFVDTGSTDGTTEAAKEWAEKIGTPINIQHFEWVQDFSKARNETLKYVKTDYWMWLDLDDSLFNREAFIQFRDNAMQFADYWLAGYDYAIDEKGNALCSFARERVVKTNLNAKWVCFLHEGVSPVPGMRHQYITTWRVKHRRSMADLQADKSRNLKIFENHKEPLNGRMLFYYGKELYEAGQKVKAADVLGKAAANENMEMHDRLLAIQYAAWAHQQCESHEIAVQLALQGLALDPNRAEYHCIIADSYIKKNDIRAAVPHYAAALKCLPQYGNGGAYTGPIFTSEDHYGKYPMVNLIKCYVHLGMMDKALPLAMEATELYPSAETKTILGDIEKMMDVTNYAAADIETDDVVISCPPNAAYPWDEGVYKEKGLGGSETAAVEVAKRIHAKTGRKVKIFNVRDSDYVSDSGVEYISNKKVNEYFRKYIPKVHIAWRHNIKLTNAKTYAWCHDLIMPGAEVRQNFDKIITLTPFHADYVSSMQGVEKSKMFICGNGIDSNRFNKDYSHKDPNKVVWMSSPDRGLKRAMKVLDIVRKTKPDIKLHVFYGLENLYKYGLGAMADELKAMMNERKDWVIYHGFTQQDKMMDMVKDATIWLHPCDFIESFCITALEMACSGIYTVTRRFGALRDTAGQFEKLGMATLLDHDCITDQEHEAYAQATIEAIDQKKWEKVHVDPKQFDWDVVTDQWIKEMDLKLSEKTLSNGHDHSERSNVIGITREASI